LGEISSNPTEAEVNRTRSWFEFYLKHWFLHFPTTIILGHGNHFQVLLHSIEIANALPIAAIKNGSITWLIKDMKSRFWQICHLESKVIWNFVPPIRKKEYQRLRMS
jgi:hypothetical protein